MNYFPCFFLARLVGGFNDSTPLKNMRKSNWRIVCQVLVRNKQYLSCHQLAGHCSWIRWYDPFRDVLLW